MRNPFDKILNWYFTKNSLPYWCIFIIDCAFVMISGFLVFWIFNNAETLFENTLQVINTMACFILLSIPGFRIFHTYSGFMRYSSFVDLMRVVYGNLVSLVLVLLAQYGMAGRNGLSVIRRASVPMVSEASASARRAYGDH